MPHVFVLAHLIYRSGYIPRVLGVLFLLAACGYLFDSLTLLFVPGYATTPAAVALPLAVAEIAFPVWPLVKGVRADRWGARADHRLQPPAPGVGRLTYTLEGEDD